jgi:Tol biopolymer transport system component
MGVRMRRARLLALTLSLIVPALYACRPGGRAPSLTPPADSDLIAFVSNRDGNREIYAMKADGTGQTRLTDDPATDGGPSWSPDGARILFSSDRDGHIAVYVMNPDGSEQVRLTDPQVNDGGGRWSPDGTRIVFGSDRDGHYEIYGMEADGSRQVRLTRGTADNTNPAWLR